MSSKAHAKLGASTAKRWLHCPGSVALIEKAPEKSESEYAKEGTRAHELMEVLLHELGGSRDELSKAEIKQLKKEYGPEMFDYVTVMRDYVAEQWNGLSNSLLVVEEKVSLEEIDEKVFADMFGTVDCAIVQEFGKLIVIDFKYGAGIAVDAEKNEQMLYYAMGLAQKYNNNFEEIELVIVQPRAYHADGEIRSWTLSMKELLGWVEIFKKGALRTKKKDASLNAGEWCRFCNAAVICPQVSKNQLKEAQIDFEPTELLPALPAPKDLAPEQIQKMLLNADTLESWIGEVRSYAFDLLNRGGKVKGFKLVEKRASRKWVDAVKVEDEASDAFGAKAFKRELLSPAQMEKIPAIGKEWVAERVVSISSGLTLAPEDDKRPAANQAQLDFKEEKETKQNGKEEKENKGKSKKENGKQEKSSKAKAEKEIDLGF